MRDLGSEQERQVTREKFKIIDMPSASRKETELVFQSLPHLGRVELGEGVFVSQEAPMRPEIKNVNGRTEPENVNVRATKPENANARLTQPENASIKVTEAENVALKATEPKNSRMRINKFPIFDTRGNEQRCPKGRDPASSASIPPTLGRNERRLCEGSPEKAELTGRYNLRQNAEKRAL